MNFDKDWSVSHINSVATVAEFIAVIPKPVTPAS